MQEYQRSDEEPVQEEGFDQEDQGEEEPEDEEFLETFMAAWRAKKKTNEKRLRRGFGSPTARNRPSGPPSSPSKSEKSDASSLADPRKAASQCADCKQLEHLEGRSRVSASKGRKDAALREASQDRRSHITSIGLVW